MALAMAAALTGMTPRRLSVAALAARTPSYEGRLIRACGWAMNQFEAYQIADHRPPRPGASMVVDWMPAEPATHGMERRCVTGIVTAVCAHPAPPPPGMKTVCVGPDWTIKQSERTAR